LASRSDVKDAKSSLSSAKGKLADLQNALAAAPAASKSGVQKDIATAKAAVDKAQSSFNAVVSSAKDYYKQNQDTVKAQYAVKNKGKLQSNVSAAEAQIASMKKQGLDTTALEKQVADAKTAADAPFQLVPPVGGLVGGTAASAVREYAKETSGAAKLIYSMKDPERVQLATALKNAGYNVPTNGKYSDQLVAQYQAAIGANQMRNTQIPNLNQSLAEFLIAKKGEVASTGTGAGSLKSDTVIYDPTQAASAVNREFQSALNRDATQKELTDFTGRLIAAQKANPTKLSTDANGNRVQTGGILPSQFLNDLIKKLPEYTAKISGKVNTQLESVLATAKANGIDATQAQIDTWTNRVKNGEDPNNISHEIRNVAGLGQPDSIKKMLAGGTDLGTIYTPYKQYMSSILEIPMENIKLNDPSLRMAIGPDKEMNLHDYQNALRQDNRWQYTQNAKDSVASTVQRVLQDFGFMG
jgi:hypothetical protein